MIAKSMLAHVKDIININDRLMYIIIKGDINAYVINAYAPTAAAETDDKANFYNLLGNTLKKVKHLGHVTVVGDFNARVQVRQAGEERHIGEHTFYKEHTTVECQNEEVSENRELSIIFYKILS